MNISAEDLANFSFGFTETIRNVTEPETKSPSQTDSDWTVGLNVISGIGILANSVLLFMVVVDLVLDKRCRKKSRHWLILHAAIIHILYLVNVISLNGMSLDFTKDLNHFKIWIHLANSFEFLVNLDFVLFGMNVIFKCFKALETTKGYKHLFLWLVLVLLMWLIANVLVYEVITSQATLETSIAWRNIITPLRMLGEYDTTLFIVMFAFPYAISIILLLISIMFRTAALKYDRSSSQTNYSSNGIESDAILFLSILILIGLFSIAPYFIFRLNDVYHIPSNDIHVYYGMLLLNIMFYVTFPIVNLCLYDIRLIVHKLISTSTMNECFELE